MESLAAFTHSGINRNQGEIVRRSVQFFLLVGIAATLAQTNAATLPTSNAHLRHSDSPYLQSHAADPVNWQQLNGQTLQQAKSTMRPLFVTSGYHACYWCYRLKQDTLSDPLLAKTLNRFFTPVLIDRELNPAEDDYLQQFMRSVMGISGWPAMVILTPAGDPLFGYTYVDPATLRGSLETFLQQWQQSASTIMADAGASRAAVADSQDSASQPLVNAKTGELLKAFLQQANAVADNSHGGFGENEKYPWLPQLLALVDLMAINSQPEVIQFVSNTVDRMLESALVHQIDGSVFRYTTTADWRAPHFEQMLYTQALMIKLLARTSQLTGNKKYSRAAVKTASSMIRNFQLPNGWFRAARSAVSGNEEDGGYYLWSRAELRHLLGEDWREKISDIGSGSDRVLPYFHDPSAIDILASEQDKRTAVTDDKTLTAWNGLALSGLSSVVALDNSLVPDARELAENFLELLSTDPLPYLATQTGNENAADLSAIVYAAGGCIDWWQSTGDSRFSEVAASLLGNAYTGFFNQGSWRPSKRNLLGPVSETPAIADSQLPSASGEWLRLAQLLILANPEKHAKLVPMIKHVEQVPASATMRDQAFFHGTTIAAKVIGELLTRVNQDG